MNAVQYYQWLTAEGLSDVDAAKTALFLEAYDSSRAAAKAARTKAAAARKRTMRKQRIMGAGCTALAALTGWMTYSMPGMGEMVTAAVMFLLLGIPLMCSRSIIIYD